MSASSEAIHLAPTASTRVGDTVNLSTDYGDLELQSVPHVDRREMAPAIELRLIAPLRSDFYQSWLLQPLARLARLLMGVRDEELLAAQDSPID